MRAKIQAILDGVPPMDTAYMKVAMKMPDIITTDAENIKITMGKESTPYEKSLAAHVRATALSWGDREKMASRRREKLPMITKNGDTVTDPRLVEAAETLEEMEDEEVQVEDEEMQVEDEELQVEDEEVHVDDEEMQMEDEEAQSEDQDDESDSDDESDREDKGMV